MVDLVGFLMVLFLHKSVTILLNFLQCPPQWTTMQIIITPGDNPLPALACTKYSINGYGEKFYTLDPPQVWNNVPMEHHLYKHLVQSQSG